MGRGMNDPLIHIPQVIHRFTGIIPETAREPSPELST